MKTYRQMMQMYPKYDHGNEYAQGKQDFYKGVELILYLKTNASPAGSLIWQIL